MFAVPALNAVTTPELNPTIATEVLLLVHVPPVTLLVSVVEPVVHKDKVPLIAVGVGFTVTVPLPVP
jgi:hypothetical protein